MAVMGACHCGAVRMTVATAPDYINECNCSLCDSHGAWWGYFAPSEVEVTGETRSYVRADLAVSAVSLHFCGVCGCTTHWTLTPDYVVKTGSNDRIGVNMRLFDRNALTDVEVRYPDGKSWDGVGQWGFVRDGVVL